MLHIHKKNVAFFDANVGYLVRNLLASRSNFERHRDSRKITTMQGTDIQESLKGSGGCQSIV